MDGQGDIEQVDREGISERFKMIQMEELQVNSIRQILHYEGTEQEFLPLITLVEL